MKAKVMLKKKKKKVKLVAKILYNLDRRKRQYPSSVQEMMDRICCGKNPASLFDIFNSTSPYDFCLNMIIFILYIREKDWIRKLDILKSQKTKSKF